MRRWSTIAVALWGAAGCSTTTADEPTAAPVTLDTPLAPSGWRHELREHAVHHGDVARRELFTWTRAEQIAQLRRDRRLLIRYRGTEGQIAAFDLRLRRRPDDPVAALLRGDAMKYRRFAWVSPWPTRRGWGERDYGDQLVRVVLAPEAWIGVLDSRNAGWRFLDLEGRAVTEERLLKSPRRLGAVYHVWHLDDGTELGGEPHAFREYVLCNEAMIARWEIASPAIVERLERDRRTMTELAAVFRRRPMAQGDLASWARRVDDERWPSPPANDARGLYESNLALLGAPHLPTAENVEAIARALAGSKTPGPPLVVMRQPEAKR